MTPTFGFFILLTFLSKLTQSRLLPPRPNEVILLDSRESGWDSWTKNTPSDIGWRQQSRPGAGYTVYGLCETSDASDREEFWLFGPLIPLGRALSVHMQVNFMMRSCADREIADGRGGTCRENFDVFLQQETRRSDMDTTEVPQKESFKKLATISSDSKWSSTYPSDDAAVTSWLIRFRPQTDQSTGLLPTSSAINGWMRLAIRDQGACLMLDRIRVYYLSCPAWQVRFMILPETPAGHDAEVREVQGHCVAGAEPTIVSQPEVNQLESSNQSQGLKPSFCKANGQWHILQDNVCECLPGYESSVEENLCLSCPMGTYKALHGTGFCRPCPPNSTSEASIASTRCVCSHPLYVWQDLANDGSGICSPKLPRISDIEIVEKNAERIIISWKSLYAPQVPILVAISCLNCQKDEAVYVPGDVLSGNRCVLVSYFPKLPRISDIEIVEKNAERIIISWKSLYAPQVPILVAISCLNCQKDEAVYVPGDVLSGNRVTILGLKANKTYTFSFRSCLNKETIPQSCDLRTTHLTVKQGQYSSRPEDLLKQNHLLRNATETELEEGAPVIRIFHVLLGLAVFICITLLFVFGTLLLHRYYKSRLRKNIYASVNNSGQTANTINPTATEYRNTLFQVSPNRYQQLPVLDPNCIEIVKPLGKSRHGETYLGSMKPSPSEGKHLLPARKIFLRPALLKTAIEAAKIASCVQHPNIVFCHGILKAVQPNFLVYNFMACGRLDMFLVSEIRQMEEVDFKRKDATLPRSPLLSNRTIFQMLHQIASAFSFLVSLPIDNIILDSSAVMVAADYSCKIQLKIRPFESSRKDSSSTNNEFNLKQGLADFIGLQPSSRIFVVREGQSILLPSILKNSAGLHSPTTLFQSVMRHLKLAINKDNLPSNSTHVKKFGYIQIELLLAAIFRQKCVLRTLNSTGMPVPNALEKYGCLSKKVAWREESPLLDDVIAWIAGWFGNEFLGCIIRSCLDPNASRQPSIVEVENHLKNYLSDKDAQNSQKGKIAAVIHNEGTLPLPVIAPLAEISVQNTPTKWNNLQLTSPCTESNPFYSPDTV
nr:ephrin type A receptor 4 A [Hymenolepis microstoma]